MDLEKVIEGIDERIETLGFKLLMEQTKEGWDETFALYEMAWHLRTALIGWQ